MMDERRQLRLVADAPADDSTPDQPAGHARPAASSVAEYRRLLAAGVNQHTAAVLAAHI